MKCPWTRETQKKIYNKMFGDSEDMSTIEIIISQFGECKRTECPFFELRTNHCRRSDQK